MEYYFKVAVKDGDDELYSNKLYFDFENLQDALDYAKHIIETTYYDIEILQCENNEEDENGKVQTN